MVIVIAVVVAAAAAEGTPPTTDSREGSGGRCGGPCSEPDLNLFDVLQTQLI